MNRSHVISLWALPCEEDQSRVQSVIEPILVDTGGAPFLPHLTLGSLSAPDSSLPDLLDGNPPFSLRPMALDGNERFTTSFFIRFELTAELQALRTSIEAHPLFRAGRDFDPHMSLCYGPPPSGVLGQESVRALLERPVQFDRVGVVELSVPIETQDHVRAFKLFETHSL